MSNIEAFVSTYQSLFPGTPTPAMPSKPEDLGLSVQLAIRENNPRLWQAMFGGHGAPLPADVAMRMAKGEIYPEDASALRAATTTTGQPLQISIVSQSWNAPGKPLVNARKQSTRSN